VLGERPPQAIDGYADYARTFESVDTYDFVRTARPIGTAVSFRYPTYIRCRYDRLARFPAGLLVTGDATCTFNPVYGQGMSVAAMNALAMRDELCHGGDSDPLRYFTAVSQTLEAPWRLAVGADLALAGVTGPVLPRRR